MQPDEAVDIPGLPVLLEQLSRCPTVGALFETASLVMVEGLDLFMDRSARVRVAQIADWDGLTATGFCGVVADVVRDGGRTIFEDLTDAVHPRGLYVRIPCKPFVAPQTSRKVVVSIGKLGSRTDLQVVLRLKPNSKTQVDLLRLRLSQMWESSFYAALEVVGKVASGGFIDKDS